MAQAPTALQCPSCGGPVSLDSRFCASCGRPVDPASLTPTEYSPATSSTPGQRARPADRFTPGQLVGGRYRVTGLLGRGGMGEVYRADDLKLGQPVALKFLSIELASDPRVRDRFLDEVRMARQVTHPNVCRVHDIGEVDGQPYLSMEYVDGEDLASLLRRIGQLPKSKALDIARQLCAGLAAAHERGMVHRDLKPANIMLDGRGQVRITDFGVAGLVEELGEGDLRSGTPAYMAPEQLAGRGVSARSDIYALGLVLYEVLTGKPAFEAGTVAELKLLRQTSTPARPSSHLEDIDPVVERVILRCLEADADDRPESALAVAASLPGGDPLRAALAAGEVPSPEMVAAAAVEGSLRPSVAVGLLAAVVVALTTTVLVAQWTGLVSLIPLDKPREVLRDRAREVLRAVGQPADPADWADGFDLDTDYLRWVEQTDAEGGVWRRLETDRRTPVLFWYRQSPRPLVASHGMLQRLSFDDPPPLVSGMASVQLDPQGRLVAFHAVPLQVGPEDPAPTAGGADWSVLFEAAGLDRGAFVEVEPTWRPLTYADERAAWVGANPESPGEELRIEAAGLVGEPVFFRVTGPWTRPERMELSPRVESNSVRVGVIVIVLVAVLLGGVVTARRNLRAGRGDRKGAFRLAVFLFAAQMLAWMLLGSHTSNLPHQWNNLVRASGFALFLAGAAWLLYVGLEPYVRRWQAERIVAWSRLVAGRFRDPLVGRDVLIGVLCGIALALSPMLAGLVSRVAGIPGGSPLETSLDPLQGRMGAIGTLAFVTPNAAFAAMFFMFLWVMLRGLLRSLQRALGGRVPLGWLADLGVIAVMFLSMMVEGSAVLWYRIGALVSALIVLLLVKRFGLLSLAVALCVLDLLVAFPIAGSPSAWYAPATGLMLIVVVALAVFGFRVSLGGRRLGAARRA